MEARAIARYQRISPRKARVVLRSVRGKSVVDALDQLHFASKAGAKIVRKLLLSAVANARATVERADLDSLVVRRAFADQAPNSQMRRWRPRAQGRATKITKGMSHLTIVVGPSGLG